MFKNKVANALNQIIVRCNGLPVTSFEGQHHSDVAEHVRDAAKDLGLTWDQRLRQFIILDETQAKTRTKELTRYLEFALSIVELLEDTEASRMPSDPTIMINARFRQLQEDLALDTPAVKGPMFMVANNAGDIQFCAYVSGPFTNLDAALTRVFPDGAVVAKVDPSGATEIAAMIIDSKWHKL